MNSFRHLTVALCLMSVAFAATASVTLDYLDGVRGDESSNAAPPGAECADLDTAASEPFGRIEGLTSGGTIGKLLCPSCLHDKKYDAHVPLRLIEREYVPPPSEAWGEFSCDDGCPRWLLRKGPDALMVVHVGAPIACGVTGWCPGVIYERSKRAWRMVDEFSSNEWIELCAWTESLGRTRIWLTPTGSQGGGTIQIEWRQGER